MANSEGSISKSLIQTSVLNKCVKATFVLILILVAAICVALTLYFFRSGLIPMSLSDDLLQVVHFKQAEVVNNNDLEISKRPLFWASRRPVLPKVEVPAAEVVKPVKRNKKLDKAVLLGVMGAGSEASVLISIGKVQHRLRIDDTLAGWVLEEVLPNGAVFIPSNRNASNFEPKAFTLHNHSPLPNLWQKKNILK